MKLDEVDLKSEIRNIKLDWHNCKKGQPVQLEISDFGFEMQDFVQFQNLRLASPGYTTHRRTVRDVSPERFSHARTH